MLRTYSEPSHIQIQTIDWHTFLLESKLRLIPLDDTPTRKKILDQLAINRSILAPIRRLPVEIQSEIFSCVQRLSPLRSLQVMTVISHVCYTWRAAARGHGTLWTKVVVEKLGDFDDYCERYLPMTRAVPLELRCDNREILPDLWDLIAPYASRWRRITLVADLSMLPNLKVLYMENLERLIVDAYDAPLSAGLSALDFVVAPRLRHLALTLDALQSERQLHVPTIRALTSVDITAMSPFPVTRTPPLLQACRKTMQSLTLRVRYPIEGPEGSYPRSASDTFVMKALTHLVLINSACALLNHIFAQVLHELIIGNVPEYGTRSLMAFLTRDQTSRHLNSLRVYTVEEKDMASWIPCLQLMDKLRLLYFDDLLSNPEFLETLFLRADRPTLLPSLRYIAIWDIFHDNPDLQDIIGRMCASRARFTVVRGRRRLEVVGWINDGI